MIGKTISEVRNDDGLGAMRLVFTDGTCVDLHPTGWEADGVQVGEERSLADVEAAEAREEAARQERLANPPHPKGSGGTLFPAPFVELLARDVQRQVNVVSYGDAPLVVPFKRKARKS